MIVAVSLTPSDFSVVVVVVYLPAAVDLLLPDWLHICLQSRPIAARPDDITLWGREEVLEQLMFEEEEEEEEESPTC